MLTKEQILNADDRKTKVIFVEEWGDDVTIMQMSGHARDRFESSIIGANGGTDMKNIRAKMVAASIVDDKGELMFSDKDIIKLSNKSGIALDKVFSAAQEFNKITDADVDELAKN